jgi:exodeoxyribonuclease V alpha subunit
MSAVDNVMNPIEQGIAQGWLKPLDRAFVQFLLTQSPQANQWVLLAAALVSHQLGAGEVYLDLAALVKNPQHTLGLADDSDAADCGQDLLKQYTLEDWIQGLQQAPELVGLGEGVTPLVLDVAGNRLYLRRYWQYQQTVTQVIDRLVQPVRDSLPDEVKTEIAELFKPDPRYPVQSPDWQKIACTVALRAKFSIITGGPGTGKTTTLTKLLAVLIKMASADSSLGRPLNIILAAPTGKAAARVSESINGAVEKLSVDEIIKQQMPRKASTLHRLLGSRPNSRQYKYNQHNRLVADVVIVDEASMIDLEMMAALLAALPDTASLILLGDKDQLASVEPGSVLGDLCHGAGGFAYNQSTLAWIENYASERLTANPASQGQVYNQQTTVLQHSYRFNDKSGIGNLAKAVNAGDYPKVVAILNAPAEDYPDLNPPHIAGKTGWLALQQLVLPEQAGRLAGYGSYRQEIKNKASYSSVDDWALAVLNAFDTFRVLSPLRRGVWGVEGLNQRIEQWLGQQSKSQAWYEGRPVMVTSNDYGLGLMNGDIGIALKDQNNKLRIAFPAGDKQIHWVSPLRLPNVETAYAMTVHKSQGSEFSHVVLVLPDQISQVLTRELIYTGITRAKLDFTLVESKAGVLGQAVVASCR